MNYIGSKYSLLDFIDKAIKSIVGDDLSQLVFCDLFAGTGIVGRHFKTQVRKVISNDIEYYSYVLNRNYIGNHKDFEGKDYYINKLNSLEGIEDGFIYTQYCFGGGNNRQYFSDENGKKIDAILDGGFKSEGVAERVLCFETDFPIEKGLRCYHNCDIKSIVTKEQFSSVEYRLEE